SKDAFIAQVQAEMRRRDPQHQKSWIVVTDGERALQRKVAATFQRFELILDLLHVLEKLWAVSYVFHPEGSPEAREFVKERILRKSPCVTAVAVLTLALGIGANTAIFTLIDAVMLKALPVPSPMQLYRLGDNNSCCVMVGTQEGGSFVLYSYALYENLRDHTPEFSELAAFEPWTSDLGVRRNGSAAEPYKGEFVSANYFNTLGVRAFAGRLLAPP